MTDDHAGVAAAALTPMIAITSVILTTPGTPGTRGRRVGVGVLAAKSSANFMDAVDFANKSSKAGMMIP
jgi:hypothetical protein